MLKLARSIIHIKKNSIIEKCLRRTKNIVYGGKAMNAQLPPHLQRVTEDYDIYSKTPKKHANRLERKLDRAAMSDKFYVKPAMHPGTYKVMDRGLDNRKGTKDDVGVADYTKPTRKVKHVNIRGINYAKLSERKKDALKSLRDPAFKFRHEKDRRDLYRIKAVARMWKTW